MGSGDTGGLVSRRAAGWLVLLGALALAAALRVGYVAAMKVPVSADPWRHMALIRNLRRGDGFTMYGGQPYVWYNPPWYYVAALLAPGERAPWVSLGFSILAVPLFLLWLWKSSGGDRTVTLTAALLLAAFGPLVAFTCQYGSEGFAVCLLAAALAVEAWGKGLPSAAVAGLLLGVALAARIQFVFDGLLFLPLLWRGWHRAAVFAAAAALPLALCWWRNHEVLATHPWVFTWDGLATRSSNYGFLSTMVVQLEPTAVEATHALHERILQKPEWLFLHGRYHWEMILFLAAGSLALVLCRKPGIALAGAATLACFLFLDRTNSLRFFRDWVGLLPVLLAALAYAASRLTAQAPSARYVGVPAMAALLAFAGRGYLRPDEVGPLDAMTPPAWMLTAPRYMVNSGYYQPESLCYRFPDKSFIGMPLHADDFDDFRRDFPEYRWILWHGFNLQTDLYDRLAKSERYEVVGRKVNRYQYPYEVMEERGSP